MILEGLLGIENKLTNAEDEFLKRSSPIGFKISEGSLRRFFGILK